MSRARRFAAVAIALPLDVPIALSIGSAALFLAVVIRVWPRTRRRRIALLVPGADIASIHQKFGSLTPYFADVLDGYFEHAYRFLFCASTSCRLELRDDFTVFSRRMPFGTFVTSYVARLVFELSWIAWRHRVALLHSRDPNFCGLIVWAASHVSRTPFCVSIHADYDKRFDLDGAAGAPTLFGSRRIVRKLEGFVLRRAGRVFPIRDHLAQSAVQLGARPDAICVTPHGIDLSPFETRADSGAALPTFGGVPNGRHIISFVGRLSRENYIDDVLAVAQRVAAQRKDCLFVMVGGGTEQARVQLAVEADPVLAGVVKVLGFQPHAECVDIRRRSAVSLALMGGFSLIEACAAGRPVIAYDVEWHSELVRDGVTGFLVREGDVESIAAHICMLIDRPDLAAKMGAAARTLAFERHSLSATVARKRHCYDELLDPSLRTQQV